MYYYSSPKDSFFVWGSKIPTIKKPLIKEPFTIGTTWVATDTFQINSSTPVKTDNNIYRNVLLVVSSNSRFIDSTWYAHGIGEIQRKHYNFGPNPNYVEYKLRSYSIK